MINVELRDHIAQARHPKTNEPVFDDNGKPVPLFPDHRSIWWDDLLIGYLGPPPQRNVIFIRSGLPDEVQKKTRHIVVEAFSDAPTKMAMVAVRDDRIDDDDDDEDGDDE